MIRVFSQISNIKKYVGKAYGVTQIDTNDITWFDNQSEAEKFLNEMISKIPGTTEGSDFIMIEIDKNKKKNPSKILPKVAKIKYLYLKNSKDPILRKWVGPNANLDNYKLVTQKQVDQVKRSVMRTKEYIPIELI